MCNSFGVGNGLDRLFLLHGMQIFVCNDKIRNYYDFVNSGEQSGGNSSKHKPSILTCAITEV